MPPDYVPSEPAAPIASDEQLPVVPFAEPTPLAADPVEHLTTALALCRSAGETVRAELAADIQDLSDKLANALEAGMAAKLAIAHRDQVIANNGQNYANVTAELWAARRAAGLDERSGLPLPKASPPDVRTTDGESNDEGALLPLHVRLQAIGDALMNLAPAVTGMDQGHAEDVFEAARLLADPPVDNVADVAALAEAAEIERRGLTPGFELQEIGEILKAGPDVGPQSLRLFVALKAALPLITEALDERNTAAALAKQHGDDVESLKEDVETLKAEQKEAAKEIKDLAAARDHERKYANERNSDAEQHKADLDAARVVVAELQQQIELIKANAADDRSKSLDAYIAENAIVVDLAGKLAAAEAQAADLDAKLTPIVKAWIKVAPSISTSTLSNDPDVEPAFAVTPGFVRVPAQDGHPEIFVAPVTP